ncbi:MAG: hypothetical protein WC291_12335 [Thermodesulfovibrionales bacterium]|jgi:hypothetical protein
MAKVIVSTVFKTTGQPTATYVKREQGAYEKRLLAGLESKGRLCLITGPSKTGKTTLYSQVLQDIGSVPIVVRCDNQLATEEFWARALEGIDFERINSKSNAKETEITGTGKIGATMGWAWLAGIIGEVSLGIKKTMNENEIRERILAKPSPQHLIPALKNLPVILVVEDFHYLSESTQTTVFQQWKAFIDNEVSVVVVGTTHHAVDLARVNKDLLGRITQIELDRWATDDLEKIAQQGFQYMRIEVPDFISRELAREAVGLPIIMQDSCRQLFFDKGLQEVTEGHSFNFEKEDAYFALHNVAVSNYAQLEALYERLKTGPRKRARKYETYEFVLSAFAKDPLTFCLRRHEIDERLDKMKIPLEHRPPAQSINSTLKALSHFQSLNGLELLEWREKDQKLYIVEPTFLFYLRWRTKRNRPPTIADTIATILASFEQISQQLQGIAKKGK